MLRLIKNDNIVKPQKSELYTILITNNRYNVINVKTNIMHSSWKDRLAAILCIKDLNNSYYRGLHGTN